MEDIVDRLRVLNFMGPWKEAADEIERLRGALKKICDGQRDAERSYADLFAEVKIEAREALKEKE